MFTVTGLMAQHSDNEEEEEGNYSPGNIFQERNLSF